MAAAERRSGWNRDRTQRRQQAERVEQQRGVFGVLSPAANSERGLAVLLSCQGDHRPDVVM